MPAKATRAMAVSPRGLDFTARLSSTTNGTANARANTVHATGAHAPCIRWWMNSVSSARSPYQITRYCDQNMYAHRMQNPNRSLPTSCSWWGPMYCVNRSRFVAHTAAAARNASPRKRLPMK